MSKFNQKEYQTVILAALLHDVGKFYQRGLKRGICDHQQLGDECFEQYFAEKLSLIFSQDEIGIIRGAIYSHHNYSEYITLADAIPAGMDRIALDREEHGDPSKERLESIFEKICLNKNDAKADGYVYHLKPLSLMKNEVFPDKLPEQDLQEEYKSLWDNFVGELKNIPTSTTRSYLNALYAILQKYTWCIPSSEPDISLFDHSKTTAAIAGCLYFYKQENLNKDLNIGSPAFLLAGGDISGIQNFIYRITKSQGEGGISKRLRGRSFYLLLFQDIIAKYIIEQIGLFQANILFCGGGRFELLLPNTAKAKTIIEDAKVEINKWLFEEHGGELGLAIETVETSGKGLSNYSELLKELDDNLSKAKKRKFLSLFYEPSFWVENKKDRIKICRVCGISKVDDDKEPCKNCKLHKDIGSELPKTLYLIYTKEGMTDIKGKRVSFGKFGAVYLVDKDIEIKHDLLKSDKIIDIQKINSTNDLKTSFCFIGNTVPVATADFSIDDKSVDKDKIAQKGDVLSFEMLAEASLGDKRISILKMDVDYLGLIFAIGLEDERNPKRKSISRISALSRLMDMFFVGYLNKICDDVYEKWKNDENNKWEHKGNVTQIFYIVYSGGDDLLIVGPWSEMPKLAKKINEEFKEYTCKNPDINISAGIFFCKPKYPISIAAKAAGERLNDSKNKGRKRITLFGDTVEWVNGKGNSFEELLSFGEELYNHIVSEEKENRLSRGFVHGLLRKYKQYDSGRDLNYIPAIIYQLSRNVKDKELRDDLRDKLIKKELFKNINIPASYALLRSRKEG